MSENLPARKLGRNVAVAGKSRVFHAFWPDDVVRAGLQRWVDGAHAAAGGNATQPRNLHMTLCFIGQVADAQLPMLSALAAELPWQPIELLLDRAGWWKHNRVAWLGCSSLPAALAQSARALRQRLLENEVDFDDKPFVPHVTLLREVRPSQAWLEALKPLAPVRWSLQRPVLVLAGRDEQGAWYQPLP
jgi:2'-5' RNA ligase